MSLLIININRNKCLVVAWHNSHQRNLKLLAASEIILPSTSNKILGLAKDSAIWPLRLVSRNKTINRQTTLQKLVLSRTKRTRLKPARLWLNQDPNQIHSNLVEILLSNNRFLVVGLRLTRYLDNSRLKSRILVNGSQIIAPGLIHPPRALEVGLCLEACRLARET